MKEKTNMPFCCPMMCPMMNSMMYPMAEMKYPMKENKNPCDNYMYKDNKKEINIKTVDISEIRD